MNYTEAYQEVSVTSEVLGASPWRLIKILLEHLGEKISLSIYAMNQNDITLKCTSITKAHDIIVYLRESLDPSADKDLCARLNGIYKHMEQLLFWANAKNDVTKLDEAQKITTNLCLWWDKVNA